MHLNTVGLCAFKKKAKFVQGLSGEEGEQKTCIFVLFKTKYLKQQKVISLRNKKKQQQQKAKTTSFRLIFLEIPISFCFTFQLNNQTLQIKNDAYV